MKRFNAWTGLAPLRAACVAALVLCGAAAAAPQVAPQSPAAQTPRPATRPAAPAATRPATQPAAARSEIGQTPIRRETIRPETARTATPQRQAAVPGYDLARVAGALAVVLGLIFTLRWVLRRSINAAGLPGATNAVQVLTRSLVSPRQQVLLLRVGRRLLVVADCNGQLNSLSEISDPNEVAALVGQLRDEKLTSASRSFGNLLGRWRHAAGDEADAEEFPRVAPEVRAEEEGSNEEVDEECDDPSIASTRSEINGLKERVRLLSHQFKRD